MAESIAGWGRSSVGAGLYWPGSRRTPGTPMRGSARAVDLDWRIALPMRPPAVGFRPPGSNRPIFFIDCEVTNDMPKNRSDAQSHDWLMRVTSRIKLRSFAGLAVALGFVLLANGCSNRQELDWADYRKVSSAEKSSNAPAPAGSFRPFGSGGMPYGSGVMPLGSGAMPYGSGAMPYGSGFMPYGSGMMPYGSGAVPYGSGTMPFGSGAMPYGSGASPMGFAPAPNNFPYGSGAPIGRFPATLNRPAYTTRTAAGPGVGRFPKYGTPYPTIQ